MIIAQRIARVMKQQAYYVQITNAFAQAASNYSQKIQLFNSN